jgi:hypothetical protein
MPSQIQGTVLAGADGSVRRREHCRIRSDHILIRHISHRLCSLASDDDFHCPQHQRVNISILMLCSRRRSGNSLFIIKILQCVLELRPKRDPLTIHAFVYIQYNTRISCKVRIRVILVMYIVHSSHEIFKVLAASG